VESTPVTHIESAALPVAADAQAIQRPIHVNTRPSKTDRPAGRFIGVDNHYPHDNTDDATRRCR
jgi:hypothetical protein